MVTLGLVNVFPALSVMRTCTSKLAVSGGVQLALYGALDEVAAVVKTPAPATRYWNVTDETPLPASEAPAPSESVPASDAPAAGDVTEPVGAVLSTNTVRSALVAWLPAASCATARRL